MYGDGSRVLPRQGECLFYQISIILNLQSLSRGNIWRHIEGDGEQKGSRESNGAQDRVKGTIIQREGPRVELKAKEHVVLGPKAKEHIVLEDWVGTTRVVGFQLCLFYRASEWLISSFVNSIEQMSKLYLLASLHPCC